jgi:hypothetical protein
LPAAVAIAVAALVLTPALAQEESMVPSRLQGVVLAAENATVELALPPDAAPGDTISGTVYVAPKEGQPSDVLDGFVLETPDKKHKISKLREVLTFTVPPTGIIPFVLRDPGGTQVAGGETLAPEPAAGFPEGPPHAVKSGEGFGLGGEFDGIAENTNGTLGETGLQVVAESPRGVFLEPIAPIPGVGPTGLEINENGQISEYQLNVMEIMLSADTLALREGQNTQVHTTVTGADGLGEGECYVVLRMLPGSAAKFVGVSGSTITHEVDPGAVSPDGTYSFDTGVVGTRPGSFTMNATLCAGNEKTFTFPNSGRRARASNDLHIEWSRAVTVKKDDPFGTTQGSGTSRTDHSDGNVGVNGSGSVTVDWNGTMPKVKRWWYTKDGKRSGPIHQGNP